MTPRERYRETINFRQPDEIPWIDHFETEGIVRWIKEGLPIDRIIAIGSEVSCGGALLGSGLSMSGFDLSSYFGSIPMVGHFLPIDIGPIPRFKEGTVREDEKYVDTITEIGSITRRRRGSLTYSMPMFVDHPVKDRESWEEYKRRLNPLDPRRYPKDWHKDSYLRYCEEYQKGPIQVAVTGLYGFGMQLMGIERFNVAFYRDPELVEDMANYWEFFTVEALRDAVTTLRDGIDQVFWWEDMASRHGPNISPRLYKRYLLNHYKRVTGFLRKNKIDRIMMDSDGNMNPLLDLISESGITGLWPLEVNAGMDAIAIRKNYGDKFYLGGNLDKARIARGGEEMRDEIDSKISILREMGGYCAGVDHVVPSDVSLEKFMEYADYLRKKRGFEGKSFPSGSHF